MDIDGESEKIMTTKSEISAQNVRKGAEAEWQIYKLLSKNGFYFRRFYGWVDLIGRVGKTWVLIEVKTVDKEKLSLTISPFNSRMAVKMARDLKALLVLVIRLNGCWMWLPGYPVMHKAGRSDSRTTTLGLKSWQKVFRPIEDLIELLKSLRQGGSFMQAVMERYGGEDETGS